MSDPVDRLVLDLSNYDASTFDPAAFRAAGVERAIVGCQREPIARSMVAGLKDAGIDVIATYGFHYFGAGGGQAHEVAQAISVALDYGIPLVFVDAELDANQAGWGDAPPTAGQRVAQIAESVARIETAGLRAGIYTGAWWWRPQTGDSQLFAHLPLWHSAYGQNGAALDPVAEVAYGGWSRVWAHQYTSTFVLAGRGRDMNYLFEEDDMNEAERTLVALFGDSSDGPDWAERVRLARYRRDRRVDLVEEGGLLPSLAAQLQTTRDALAGHVDASHPGNGGVPPHKHEAEVTIR